MYKISKAGTNWLLENDDRQEKKTITEYCKTLYIHEDFIFT